MRLDLTNKAVQEYFGFVFNDEDPGATNKGRPIDLCYPCFCALEFHDEDECPERPDYIPELYYCWECGFELDDQED